jgi:leucyl-tRNA synthetase
VEERYCRWQTKNNDTMEYVFNGKEGIEQKWQEKWKLANAYRVNNVSDKPKYYVLDMFPYPSGAGLHVGHPLGYIASDIYSRYKRLKGFNVLHPMGFDSFGLPAEQYAIETGQHPATTTEKNIETFKKQLDKIGFCYDWEREVRTSDPGYYKWTQWIFLQLYNSYFCNTQQKARPIADLIKKYETAGTKDFSAEEWNAFDEKQKSDWLMKRRLAYCGFGEVNWCEALGTVLANDEVVNGVSERGGHPVEKKKLRQWYLRITAYADRLLQGLNTVDFSEAMKEMQSNWIGKSSGAEIDFAIKGSDKNLRVYTTRPDTIFGVDFMVLAPELDLIQSIQSPEQTKAVEAYIAYVKSRSERERMAEKKISGCFTGAYAINPFDGREIPVWISEYVLAGYGTGAIMAVPCGDERDFAFANHFGIPITNIIGNFYTGEAANPTKEALLEQSGFLTGMKMSDAIEAAITAIEEKGIGTRKINFRMRDAAFSRQRYWGEPFPITWKEGTAKVWEGELPLTLPHVEKYGPGPDGAGPLANIPEWVAQELETNTMPGYAGSSWYFLRYMDPQNTETFCDRKASDYWNQVDVYIGGTEHAVGHLLYSRMWTKILFDLGLIGFEEPFKKLVNQGMIQGSSRFVYSISNVGSAGSFQFLPFEFLISNEIIQQYQTLWSKNKDEAGEYILQIFNSMQGGRTFSMKDFSTLSFAAHRVPVEYVDGTTLDQIALRKFRPDYLNATFVTGENGAYQCGVEVEKMSKSKYNTVNPDELCEKYGADTFRMYEMFLGPVEQSKPWDTKGIEGVHRFLRKLWRLFNDDIKGVIWNNEKATDAELKILHRAIKKIEEDTEKFSFNTAVSAFMICVNDLSDVKCHKKEVLEKILILLVPYAPHISEELWQQLGNEGFVIDAAFPSFDASLLVESSKEYPISINGKVRANILLSLSLTQEEVEQAILANETVQKWLEGKSPKRIIYVKNKMINVVI